MKKLGNRLLIILLMIIGFLGIDFLIGVFHLSLVWEIVAFAGYGLVILNLKK